MAQRISFAKRSILVFSMVGLTFVFAAMLFAAENLFGLLLNYPTLRLMIPLIVGVEVARVIVLPRQLRQGTRVQREFWWAIRWTLALVVGLTFGSLVFFLVLTAIVSVQ